MGLCSIDGCGRAHYGRTWCSLHYQRWLKHGDPTIVTKRQTALDWLVAAIDGATSDECVDWPFARSHGYGVVVVDGGRTIGAHRYVCRLVHGEPPTGRHEAAHSCGRSQCVNPAHLRWATPTENEADKLTHGTHNRGERYGASKLTEAAVRSIRSSDGTPSSRRLMADRFGVSYSTVCDVLAGRSWGWLR